MRLLRDTDILKWVAGTEGYPPLITDFVMPDTPFGKSSPIQPSSLDLTIGGIFLPEADSNQEGGLESDTSEHWLNPGQTAVVVTKEKLAFPNRIAGFGFPPTRISSNGILMTNPGHIDPGFQGYLTFTVINMGRAKFQLRRGALIVTCLLVDLGAPVEKDFSVLGHGPTSSKPSCQTMDRLSSDFLDFKRRSEEVATSVAKAREWTTIVFALISTILAVVLAILPLYFGAMQPLADLRAKVSDTELQTSERSCREVGGNLRWRGSPSVRLLRQAA